MEGLHPSRKLENMIFLMDRLDELVSSDLYAPLNSPLLYAIFRTRLKELARKRLRIQFCEPVPMPEIRSINQYDLGIYLMSPTNFNNRMALPNKLLNLFKRDWRL